jgi:hypothetical protein
MDFSEIIEVIASSPTAIEMSLMQFHSSKNEAACDPFMYRLFHVTFIIKKNSKSVKIFLKLFLSARTKRKY